jgi:hypothetical protein
MCQSVSQTNDAAKGNMAKYESGRKRRYRLSRRDVRVVLLRSGEWGSDGTPQSTGSRLFNSW